MAYLFDLKYVPNESIIAHFNNASRVVELSSFPLSYKHKTIKEWTKIFLPRKIKISPHMNWINRLGCDKKYSYKSKSHFIQKYMTIAPKDAKFLVSKLYRNPDYPRIYENPLLPPQDNHTYAIIPIATDQPNTGAIYLPLSHNKETLQNDYQTNIRDHHSLSEHEKINNIKFFNTQILPILLKDGPHYDTILTQDVQKFSPPYTPLHRIVKNINTHKNKKGLTT